MTNNEKLKELLGLVIENASYKVIKPYGYDLDEDKLLKEILQACKDAKLVFFVGDMRGLDKNSRGVPLPLGSFIEEIEL